MEKAAYKKRLIFEDNQSGVDTKTSTKQRGGISEEEKLP